MVLIGLQAVFSAGITSDLSSEADSVLQTPDGGCILAGPEAFQPGLAGFATSWLAKTTATGALSWQHVFNGPINTSLLAAVRLIPDGATSPPGPTTPSPTPTTSAGQNRRQRQVAGG